MKKSRRIVPMMGKKLLLVNLEPSVIKRLDRLAEYQFCKLGTFLDIIVKNFTPKFEDIIMFAKGGYTLSFQEKLIKYLNNKEVKKFLTIQVDEVTFKKLNDSKKYYGMNKSMVLKHIINQYERGNNV